MNAYRTPAAVFLLSAVLAGTARAEERDFSFPPGEKLVYKLYWGIIPVGRAEFTAQWSELDGKKVLLLKAVARTSYIVAKIYPVDDRIESIVDPVSLLPLVYTQKLREGRHVRDDKVVFRHAEGIAKWESGDGKQKMDIKIDADTRDVLSLVYHMRSGNFGEKQKENFRVLVDNKLYDLDVAGIKSGDLSVGRYGKVECLEVEPVAKFGEIFVRKGSVRLWFSNDARRICTRMTGKVPLAHVKALLFDVRGPGDDFWVSGNGDDAAEGGENEDGGGEEAGPAMTNAVDGAHKTAKNRTAAEEEI